MSPDPALGPCKALLLLLLLSSVSASTSAGVPPWVQVAARAESVPGAEATVLLAETSIEIGRIGRRERTVRRVLRVDTEAGAASAVDLIAIVEDASRVLAARAWLLGPDGKRREVLEFEDALALSLLGGHELHDEGRQHVFDLSGRARPGDVVATEWQLVERSVFAQERWVVGEEHPIRLARLRLELREGWTVESRALRGPAPELRSSGRTSTWERRDLPGLAPEALAPPLAADSWTLGISWFPPEGTRSEDRLDCFRDWAGVAAWLLAQAEPSAALDDGLRAEAARLAAGSETPIGRIHAIAERVQALRYVSLQMGTGAGGGYRPSAASEVLARGHGDCKDKTTLMRALLAAVGVESWPVVTNLSAPETIRPGWPAPQQFDHCIVAARAPPGFEAPAVAEHPRLGPLLYFDPTEPSLPLGRLPFDEQGARSLLVADGETGLSILPVDPVAAGSVDRRLALELEQGGGSQLHYRERASGLAEQEWRTLAGTRPELPGLEEMKAWAARQLPGIELDQVEWTEAADGSLELELSARAPRHARLLGGRVLRVPAGLVHWAPAVDLDCASRSRRIRLEPRVVNETLRIRPPAGFVLDERPPGLELEVGGSRYREKAEEIDGVLVITRRLEQAGEDLEPRVCDDLQSFLAATSGQGSAPAVFVRR